MIEQFEISGFRGITELAVRNLRSINLIVGDNNCGKTSVLEALLLLRDPGNLANLFRVARTRDTLLSGISLYDNFLYMFPRRKNQSTYSLGIFASYDGTPLACQVTGTESKMMVDPRDVQDSLVKIAPQEADAFDGEILYQINNESGRTHVSLNSYSRSSNYRFHGSGAYQMCYISPADHLQGDIINRILKNDGYKRICLSILQLFDPEIEDVLLLNGDTQSNSVEYIRHRLLGTMPLSTYGDGIKKVLSLANAIAQTQGGILLVDEVETAIHKKYYNDIFAFLVKACKKFETQLFLTTHSIEAVDALLATQAYDQQDLEDNISVVTLKRFLGKTYSRSLSGRQVAKDREAFDFEVLQ